MQLSRTARDLLLALLAVVSIALVFIAKPPLQCAHWDAPIYLQCGKIADETMLCRLRLGSTIYLYREMLHAGVGRIRGHY